MLFGLLSALVHCGGVVGGGDRVLSMSKELQKGENWSQIPSDCRVWLPTARLISFFCAISSGHQREMIKLPSNKVAEVGAVSVTPASTCNMRPVPPASVRPRAVNHRQALLHGCCRHELNAFATTMHGRETKKGPSFANFLPHLNSFDVAPWLSAIICIIPLLFLFLWCRWSYLMEPSVHCWGLINRCTLKV